FRYQTLKQRWVTLGSYWDRITRQIEEGTYYRDVQRARRRKKREEQRTEAAAARQAFELDLEGSVDLEAEVAQAIDALAGLERKSSGGRPRRSSAPPEQRRRRRPPPAPDTSRSRKAASLDEPHIRKIYDAYVAARRRNNESVDNLRFETMERRLKKMVPKLQEKHGKSNIDFKIVLKNGKVGLKPVASD
ncbi:MAG: MXAN_5187 C-terminal domain-containing protein, partial [Myxococcota bacterium]